MACALKGAQPGFRFESPTCLQSAKVQRSRWDLVTAVKAKREQTVVKGLCRKSDRETATFVNGTDWGAITRGWQSAIWDVLLVGSEPGECVLQWPSVIIQAIASMLLGNPERRMYKYFVNLR